MEGALPRHTLYFLTASPFYPQTLHGLQSYLYSIPNYPLQLPQDLAPRIFTVPWLLYLPSLPLHWLSPFYEKFPLLTTRSATTLLNIPSTGGLELTPTSLQEPMVKISGILQDRWHHVSSLRSAMVGVFTLVDVSTCYKSVFIFVCPESWLLKFTSISLFPPPYFQLPAYLFPLKPNFLKEWHAYLSTSLPSHCTHCLQRQWSFGLHSYQYRQRWPQAILTLQRLALLTFSPSW